MIASRREAFEPEVLATLGSAFDEMWNVVSQLGAIDPNREIAARIRLANIMLLLARSEEFDAEEIKRMAVRIFTSIEIRAPELNTLTQPQASQATQG